jgi:acyl-CoA dehydrogenase
VTYHAPLADMSFALKYGASLLPALEEGFLGDLSMDDVEAVLSEAGRMAAEVLAPLNRTGDRVGASIKDGVVTTAPGWREAYDAWRKGGWNGLTSPTEWGGHALPQIVCTEMWNGACMAFGVGPLLTMGAIDALNAHGSDVLKRTYLEKLVTGEWMGTMHLTEPQAGSDVGALRTRVHADNGPFQALADCVRLLWPVSGPVRQARACSARAESAGFSRRSG